MKYRYKSVKYTAKRWLVLKRLSDMLSKERGVKVSIPDATIEAVVKLIDEHEAERETNKAGTPGGQAQD